MRIPPPPVCTAAWTRTDWDTYRVQHIDAEIARMELQLALVDGDDIGASNARQNLRHQIYDLRQEAHQYAPEEQRS